jgi:hypothetical protein
LKQAKRRGARPNVLGKTLDTWGIMRGGRRVRGRSARSLCAFPASASPASMSCHG